MKNRNKDTGLITGNNTLNGVFYYINTVQTLRIYNIVVKK